MRFSERVTWAIFARWAVTAVFLGSSPSTALAGYAFTGGGTATGTATGDSGTGPLYIVQFSGIIYHSTDGTVFSPDWGGGSTIAASAANTINVHMSAGNGSTIQFGHPALSGASTLQALLQVYTTANTSDQVTVDDTSGTAATYTINEGPGSITSSSGFHYFEGNSSVSIGGGVTLKSPGGTNTFAIQSTYASEPFRIAGGAGDDIYQFPGPNFASLASPVAIADGGGANTLDFTGTTVNLNVDFNAGVISGVTGIDLTAATFQHLVGGSGSDHFTVEPGANPLTIDGGDPVPPASPGDTLVIGMSPTAVSYTSTASGYSGQYSFASFAPISFQDIEGIVGGTATGLSTSCRTTFVENQPFTFTASVIGFSPTGTATFYAEGNAVCSNVPLVSGAASCTVDDFPVIGSGTEDTYQLTASYSGDGSNLASDSNALPLQIAVLSAAEVVFRGDFEEDAAGCPLE